MSERRPNRPRSNWAELTSAADQDGARTGPLVVFFIVNGRADIFAATAWFMGAMVVSLVLSWLLLKKIAVMPLVTGVVVLIFGGLTLWLQDDTFIKMKPTIVNLAVRRRAAGRAGVRPVAAEICVRRRLQAEAAKAGSILTLRWGLFFVVLAVLNEVVWRGTMLYLPAKERPTPGSRSRCGAIMPLTIVFAAASCRC